MTLLSGADAVPRAMERAGTIRLPARLLAAVRAHAEAAYPEECCGALLGRVPREPEAAREIVRAVAVRNQSAERRADRFLIPAAAVRALDRAAAQDGLAVIGFYHSHPDGPPRPSRLDAQAAWPWYSYLIVAVSAGGAGEAGCWRLTDDRRAFLPEAVLSPEEGP